jgi:hypothetical protein
MGLAIVPFYMLDQGFKQASMLQIVNGILLRNNNFQSLAR